MHGFGDDHIALVVGGGSGIGRATALLLARRGARVVVSDLNSAAAEMVVGEIESSDGVARAATVDVTDVDSVRRLRDHVVDTMGRIDSLVHCAADVHFVNTMDDVLTELADETWSRMLDIHLTGAFHVLREVGRQMASQKSGAIVVTSTTDALIGCARLDSYTAAKGGVTAMVRSFAAGIGPSGVRVNAIAPSFVTTEPQMVWLDDDDAMQTIQRLHILPVPSPEQVASVAAFLVSSDSVAITGAVIPVDAGYMAFKADLDVVGTMQDGYVTDTPETSPKG